MKTLLITIAPSVIILLYFFLSDKFKEPKGTIALVFVLGVLICFPAGILNTFMTDNFGNAENYNDLTFYRSVIFNKPFLKNKKGNFKGYPFRTYVGSTFMGGYSDHFPVYLFLVKKV